MIASGLPLELGRDRRRPRAEFLVGVEHEFRVLDGDRQVDFRELLHHLPIDGRRIDPGDSNAYRCRSGISVTADGPEAEFATPPIAIRPGFTSELSAWVAIGRGELEAAIPGRLALEGYSTHISVTVPAAAADGVASRFVAHFAATFALLLEGPRSQGIYVRPRPGRLELCGDFAEGDQLNSAVVYAVGAVLACRAGTSSLNRTLQPGTLPGVERYGLRVRRDAYGLDLYSAGRRAPIPLASGEPVFLQDHLDEAWAAARPFAANYARPAELRLLDDIVAGRRPLGVERLTPAPASPCPRQRPQSAFGNALAPQWRVPFGLSPAVMTWELTVFLVSGARPCYAAVPRDALERFQLEAHRGRLDRQFGDFQSAPSRGRTLESRAQVTRPALFDALGDPAALVAPERPPAGPSLLTASRPGKLLAARRWKAAVEGPPQPPLSYPPPPPALGDDDLLPELEPEPPGEGPPPPSGAPPEGPVPPPPPTFWTRFAVVAVAIFAFAGAVGAFALIDATRSDTSHAVTATATRAPTRAATASSSPSASPTRTATASPAATHTPTATPTRPSGGAAVPLTATPTREATEAPTETPATESTPTASPTSGTTPSPTAAPTKTPPPTATPSPTPTETPPPTIIAIGTVCVPSKGVVCP